MSGSRNKETTECAEIMLLGKHGGVWGVQVVKLLFQLKTQVYPKTEVLHQILASGKIPEVNIY